MLPHDSAKDTLTHAHTRSLCAGAELTVSAKEIEDAMGDEAAQTTASSDLIQVHTSTDCSQGKAFHA